MGRVLKYVIVGLIPAVILGIVLVRLHFARTAETGIAGEGSGPPATSRPRKSGDPVPPVDPGAESRDKSGDRDFPTGENAPDTGSGGRASGTKGGDPGGSRDSGNPESPANPSDAGTAPASPTGSAGGTDPPPRNLVPYTLKVVSRSRGEPIAGARVALSVKGVGFFREETGEEGEVSIPLPGEFSATCVVLSATHAPKYEAIDHGADSRDRRHLIRLEDRARDGAVPFEVRDHFTSSPIRGAVVTISDGTLTAWDRTDGHGAIGLPRGFFASPISLKVEFENYHGAKTSIREPADADGHSVGLFPKDPLTIRIRSREGNPIWGGTVRFRPTGKGWRGARIEKSTNEIGEAVFPEITTGPNSGFDIAVACKGFLSYARRWSIEEYEACCGVMTISLESGQGVHGILTGFEIADEKDLVLEVLSSAAGEENRGAAEVTLKTVPIVPGGTFFLDAVRPGEAEVRLRRGGRVFHLGKVAIEENGYLEIEIPEPAEIHVRVLATDGRAVGGAKVFVCRRDEGFPMELLEGEADGKGTFSFQSCTPGVFDGAVKAKGFLERGFKFEIEKNTAERIVDVRMETIR